jgi:oxygen-dependent protoporphyrinogen oxidase
VIVAGAGLSGLACAFDLFRGGAEVVLLDAAPRVGGVVGTIERDGFRFETGPTTIQAGAEEFRRLCGDLGIADRLVVSSAASEMRYLFHDGKLHRLPSSPGDLLRSDLLSLRGRMAAASEPLRRWKPPPEGAPEPDLEAFLVERVGAEAARIFGGAFVRGVYAAELAELGARSAFPSLWKACAEHGGLVRGLVGRGRAKSTDLPGPDVSRTALISFPGGLEELVLALARALERIVRTRARVESIETTTAGWRVQSGDGATDEAGHLVLAVPAPAAARLLEGHLARELSLDTLRGIRHADVTLVHLGLDAAEVEDLPPGFGFLVPPGEARAPRALGTIFLSSLFPNRAPEGSVALSSFYAQTEVVGLDDGQAALLACEDLARALGRSRAPRARTFDVRRWTDVIPRYAPGHADRIAELLRATARVGGLHLAGSYVAGVSVEQVIARGRAVAREILGREIPGREPRGREFLPREPSA